VYAPLAPLPGYLAQTGTITPADTIISAIQKLDGNLASLGTTALSTTWTVTFAGAATSPSTTWRVARVGNLTTAHMLTVASGTTSASAGSGLFTSLSSLPDSRFFPESEVFGTTVVTVGGSRVIGTVAVFGDGRVIIYAGPEPAGWATSQAYSFGPINITWFTP